MHAFYIYLIAFLLGCEESRASGLGSTRKWCVAMVGDHLLLASCCVNVYDGTHLLTLS